MTQRTKKNWPVIDFHTHSLISDGVLGPAEVARYGQVAGYAFMGLTDHVDHGTLAHSIATAMEAARGLNSHMADFIFLPGVEITHAPPSTIGDLTQKARDLGAALVVVHGETLAEPVAPGTNLAAIQAGVDILAHPGLITEAEAALAAEKGVFLELSGRGRHGLTNGLVADRARRWGARLLVNSDGHAPSDFLTSAKQKNVALGAGLSPEEFDGLMAGALELAGRLCLARPETRDLLSRLQARLKAPA